MRKLTTILLVLLASYTAVAQMPIEDSLGNIPTIIQNYNPAAARNYRRVMAALKPTQDTADVTINSLIENVLAVTQYFDQLNKPLQTVAKQVSPLKRDVVTPVLYDGFGRNTMAFLPYVQSSGNTNDGKYKQTALIYDSAFNRAMFPGENTIYSETVYDASPLQRLLKAMPPGNSWAGAGRGKEMAQRANATSDSVRLWEINIDSESDVAYTTTVYQAGSLMVSEVTDEKGAKKIVYTNEHGQIILTKVQLSSTPSTGHTGWLCTYYVYDEMNHLRTVLPPKAVESLIGVSWDLEGNSAITTGLCYRYFYDAKGRMTMKKIPGAGKQYMVYDYKDRLVMFQDDNMRSLDIGYVCTLYDDQDRPTQTYLWFPDETADVCQSYVDNNPGWVLSYSTPTLLTETYYDDYSWLASNGNPFTSSVATTNITSTNFYTTYNTFPEYATEISQSSRIRGSVTGTKRRVVGTSTFLYSSSFYDDYGRVIQSKETNYSNGTDVVTMQYGYSGRILRSHVAHQKSGTNAQNHTVLTKYHYDHGGRLDTLIKKIDGASDKILFTATYNELGQLTSKKLAPSYNSGSGLEMLNYDYNIRGWLLGMNRQYISGSSTTNWFGFELGYDNTTNIVSGQSYAAAMYDGNISGTTWKSKGDAERRKFDYSYDNSNRLTAADFNQYTGSSFNKTRGIDYSVSTIDYDVNGNILKMVQKGLKISSSATIDSLVYSYTGNSNQLVRVTDGIAGDNKLGDFKDGTNSGTDDYSYDGNGNLASDQNKKVTRIDYNYLNLTDSIRILGKGTIKYTYDAAGNKLQKKTVDSTGNSIVTNITAYMGAFLYENNVLQFVSHEEGRVRLQSEHADTLYFDYMLKDHLGNVRIVLTDEQKIDIYQAGMETANATPEEALFGNIADLRVNKPSGFDTDGSNAKVSRLIGLTALTTTAIGPYKMLKVMAGDKFKVSVYGMKESTAVEMEEPIYPNLATLLTNLFAPRISNFGKQGMTSTQVQTIISPQVSAFLSPQENDPAENRAYLNWILLDEEQLKLVSGANNSGYEELGNASSKTFLQSNNGDEVEVTRNGYLFVYVSNSSGEHYAYFDDLRVEHIRGRLLEETHYYPFGLTMAAISSKAAGGLQNNFKSNGGTELNGDLELYYNETFFRNYDVQIHRFIGMDPLSESTTDLNPYQFCANNPVLYVDPLGDRYSYMDSQGNKWHHGDILAGTGGAGTPWREGFGFDGFGDLPAGMDMTLGTGAYRSFWTNFMSRILPNLHSGVAYSFQDKEGQEDPLYYDYHQYRSPDGSGVFVTPNFHGNTSFTEGQLYTYTGIAHSTIKIDFGAGNVSPWEVGYEWLSGSGPRDRTFTNGDKFTELLKQHEHIEETRRGIRDKILAGESGSFSGKSPYNLGGLAGVPKYLRDYSTLLTGGLTGNLAVTYLGSYNLSYNVLSVTGNSALVQFMVTNSSTISSATHPPVIGYTKWWDKNIGTPLDKHFATGPLSKTNQTFIWTETVRW
jgi:RHS repeat-associated protein